MLQLIVLLTLPLISEAMGDEPLRPSHSRLKYMPPSELLFDFKPVEGDKTMPPTVFEATIVSKIGTNSEIEITFNSSPDLKVAPIAVCLDVLAAGHSNRDTIRVTRVRPLKDGEESWIRMAIKYLPDYPEILRTVEMSSDYPNAAARFELLKNLKDSAATRFKPTISTRHFFHPEAGREGK